MVDLVDTYQSRGKLEHVIPQRNNDELGVLGTLLDIRGHDRDLIDFLARFKRQARKVFTYISEIQSGVYLIHDI